MPNKPSNLTAITPRKEACNPMCVSPLTEEKARAMYIEGRDVVLEFAVGFLQGSQIGPILEIGPI